MPKRRRAKHNEDVIKTECDYRRATGAEGENDFEESDVDDVPESRYSTVHQTKYKRLKERKTTAAEDSDSSFPFMRLPIEIRNMIYRYLLVSKASGPIRLQWSGVFEVGGIETAILATNRQVHDESSIILYNENRCITTYDRYQDGISVRIDDQKTKSATSRTLRSGRHLDMVKHRGLIYKKSLLRLRHVEFQVNIFDRGPYCEHATMHFGRILGYKLRNVFWILVDRWQKLPAGDPHGLDWVVKVKLEGEMPLSMIKRILRPLRKEEVAFVVYKNLLRIDLIGAFPEGWREIFHPLLLTSAGLNIDKVVRPTKEPRVIDFGDIWRFHDRLESWDDREFWEDEDLY